MKKKLIWIDDDYLLLRRFKPIFAEYGYTVIGCETISKGLQAVLQGRSANLLLDVDFPGSRKEGLIFLEQIKRINPQLRVVVFTGYPEYDDAVRAIRDLTAADYISKDRSWTDEDSIKEFFGKLDVAFPDTVVRAVQTKTVHDASIENLVQVREALEKGNVKVFISILQSFFASLSYNMKVTEGYFHGYIVLILKMLGMRVEPESETNQGRIDAVVETDQLIYLMEFKLSDAEIALKQIWDRKYFQKFFTYKKQIILVGIAFDTKEKNISNYVKRKWNR